MPSTAIASSISITGGLFPSSLLARLASFDERLDGMTPIAYGCLPGESLRDGITDAWNRLQRVWSAFQAHRTSAAPDSDATGDTRQRWLLPFFQVLGYTDLERAPAPEIDGKTYRLSHLYRQVPIHLIGHRLDLDKRVAGAAGAAASNAHGLVQEFLNRSSAHQWGIVSNGLTLRLLRDNASLTRQAYLEVDLAALFDQHAYHDFVQLWLLLHASRFHSTAGATAAQSGDTYIDRWYATGTQEGVRALDRLRDNVQSAIEHLGRGFLTSSGPGNRALREALAGDRLSAQDYYRELLRTVYRLLFCFVAEDRDVLLLPTATAVQRDRYTRWYATSRLRRLVTNRAGTPHGDGWKSLQLIFRWLSSDTGCPALGVPALGSLLWSTEATPHLDTCTLSNQALFAALRALAVTTDSGVRRSIDFKNLGAEELGGIYESLLELHPELSAESGAFSLKAVAGSERKTTGSYYTPTSLIKCLLDSALDPVVEAAASKPTPAEAEQAILDLTVVDPACGSGHFLVAAAHRIAKRLASVRTGDLEPAPDAVRHALRDVISRCIYGVDLNPMSVELCKVSLWLEAIDPGRPLSFLDHRIRCGNSLIGTRPDLVAKGVPDEAFDPITGDDKDTCKQGKKSNKTQRAQMATQQTSLFAVVATTTATPLDALRRGDDTTVAGVARLAQAWEQVERDPTQQRAHWAADAWVAAFLAPKTPGATTITSDAVRIALQTGPHGLDPDQRSLIQRMSDEYRVFHWHIAFPELFGEGRPNGFSVVLGNPPWEHTELKEVEWFASRDERIANAGTGAERKRYIAALERENPNLWQAFCHALRHHTAIGTYAGSSGRYPLCGRGRINTYAIFAELILGLVNDNGRAGFIVPTGIATDDGNKFYFQQMVDGKRLVSLYDFENREGIFPAIDSRIKFSLLTLAGTAAQIPVAWFVFFAQGVADLGDLERRISLSPEDIARINPNTRTCPIFRTRRDAEITKSIYQRIPVLLREARNGCPEENLWGIVIRQGIFNMTSDSGLFKIGTNLESDGWHLRGNRYIKGVEEMLPVVEGKCFSIWDHRFADVYNMEGSGRTGGVEELSATEKSNPSRLSQPRYWMSKRNVHSMDPDISKYSWIPAFKDISAPTNERTFIATPLPIYAIGNTTPIIKYDAKHSGSSLVACLASFAFDFVVRQKMGGLHLNFYIVHQLPVVPPARFHEKSPWSKNQTLLTWISPYTLELGFTANDLNGFAESNGYQGNPFLWNEARRRLLKAELDAAFFHIYGLGRDEIDHILDTFPIVKRKDEAQYGDYRTKRLILEAYDAMADAIRIGHPFQTKLDPPPADSRCAHGAAIAPRFSTANECLHAGILALLATNDRINRDHLQIAACILTRPSSARRLLPSDTTERLQAVSPIGLTAATVIQELERVHTFLVADGIVRRHADLAQRGSTFAHVAAQHPSPWSQADLLAVVSAADRLLATARQVIITAEDQQLLAEFGIAGAA